MKLLRETVRKIILMESMSPELKEVWDNYHDKQRADAAISEIRSVFVPRDQIQRQMRDPVFEVAYEPEPGCDVRIRVNEAYGVIWFDEIETTPACEGKGYAKKAIEMLKSIAAKHQVAIQLEPKAFNQSKGEGRMSSASLHSWYASLGFKPRGWFPGDKPLQWLPK